MIIPNFDYFLRIVEYKNISKAAESLFLTQPSLTKYLQRLEADVGAPLFDRTQTPLKLTDAGTYFYNYIKNVQSEEKNLSAKIQEIKSGNRAKLCVGMPLWRANVLLPEFLPIFFKKYPLIEFKLKEGSAAVLENAIMNEDVDFCLMNLPVNYANILYEPIVTEHIFAVGGKNMPLAQRLSSETKGPIPHVDIRVLAQQPFILTQPGQHITQYIENMISRNNVELNCLMRTSNVSTAINLAAAGLGFTFVPELGVRSRYFPTNDVSLFTVDTPPLTCTFAAVYKKSKYLSIAAQSFIEELIIFCKNYNDK